MPASTQKILLANGTHNSVNLVVNGHHGKVEKGLSKAASHEKKGAVNGISHAEKENSVAQEVYIQKENK